MRSVAKAPGIPLDVRESMQATCHSARTDETSRRERAEGYTRIIVGTPSGSFVSWLLRYASRLRHPQLFLLTLGLFALDLVVPDVVPFVDEILLGLLTVLLGTWPGRRGEPERASDGIQKPPEKDVTPGRGP